MSKGTIWAALVVLGLALAGGAVAQEPSPPDRGPMGPHMIRGEPGMMGPGMMGMSCPMMMPGAELKVEKLENGVSLSMTPSDPKVAARIQKRAEIMRLMHELQQDEP